MAVALGTPVRLVSVERSTAWSISARHKQVSCGVFCPPKVALGGAILGHITSRTRIGDNWNCYLDCAMVDLRNYISRRLSFVFPSSPPSFVDSRRTSNSYYDVN